MWYNAIIAFILRSPLHSLMSGNTLLITYTGRKSGKQYTTPINYVRTDGCLWATSRRERTWWRNLSGGAKVAICMQGRDRLAQAEAFSDDAGVRDGLMTYLSCSPRSSRFFGVRLTPDGKPDANDVAQAARSRVVIRIKPVQEEEKDDRS